MPSIPASHPRLAIALILSLCLGACGGGSGGSGTGGQNGNGNNTPPPPAVVTAPAISTQPLDISASVGASVSFSVTATGTGPLSYQWQRNGVDVAGATGAQYVIQAAQFADSASKWNVVVRNSAGVATSTQATLTVTGIALLAGSAQAIFGGSSPVGLAQDGKGNIYLLDRMLSTALYKVDAQGVVTQLPLTPRESRAALYQPAGMARDAAGNFYVIDDTCSVRKISPAGEITVLAGGNGQCGNDDGKGSAATLGYLTAITVDAASNVYVGGQAVIRKITPDGTVTTLAGSANEYGTVDGAGAVARFGGMKSMATDSADNLYVTDAGVTGTAPSVRKITPAGLVSTLAGGISYGSADGQYGAATFRTPAGLTVDAAGNVYVGDQTNHSIRKITQNGVVTTIAGQSTTQEPAYNDYVDGPVATAKFRQPVALTIDNAGNILLAEGSSYNALRKIGIDGMVSTIAGSQAGSGATDGLGAAAKFSVPRGLAVDTWGNVWVADTGNQLIRKIVGANATVFTLAGATGYATLTDPGDGKGTQARFFKPTAVAVDPNGPAYVADSVHNTVRKVLSDGTVTTLAGKVWVSGAVDGIGSAAIFGALTSITMDRSGILYATDYSAIRRIDPATGAVTTLAGLLGPFNSGSTDGTGSAARFGWMPAIAADSAGNVYVVDSLYNNVRKITPNGVVTTLAGTAGVIGSTDGQGAAASFNSPQGIAVDAAGYVYVADTGNNLIRRITPAGVVTTVAGQAGANGIILGGLNNPLSQPIGLAFDAKGTLYVTASNGVFQLRLQ